VLDILIHIEFIIKRVPHTFCSRVYLCLDYFKFSECGNITKRDFFYTNIERFGIYYIRRCSHQEPPHLFGGAGLGKFLGRLYFCLVCLDASSPNYIS